MLGIDHVVRAVADLDAAAERLRAEHGLITRPGGVHPRWGTANMIAPLGRDYVELISVVDRSVAQETPLGRGLLDLTAGGDAWFAVCLADDRIEETAARLGLSPEPGARRRPDGREVAWVGAGIEDPRRTPDLPFFISWKVSADLHPGASPPAHPCGATGIAWVEVAGDSEVFAEWTDAADLPVRFLAGTAPGLVAVGLEAASGEIVLR